MRIPLEGVQHEAARKATPCLRSKGEQHDRILARAEIDINRFALREAVPSARLGRAPGGLPSPGLQHSASSAKARRRINLDRQPIAHAKLAIEQQHQAERGGARENKTDQHPLHAAHSSSEVALSFRAVISNGMLSNSRPREP
jgi:hypothetical protein